MQTAAVSMVSKRAVGGGWGLALGAALALLLGSGDAIAKEVAGVKLPNELTLAPGDTLALNGAGVRRRFFVKVYVGALYLPRPLTEASAVLAHDGPAAMHMHFLYSEVSAEKLVAGWNDGFSANLPPEQLARLKEPIGRFNAMFRTVRSGERVRLEYQPSSGTAVYINEELRGRIEGAEFFNALLRIWLGEEPVDADLKRDLLGSR